MKVIYVIAGPNGSGKSSVISSLYRNGFLKEEIPYLCADSLLQEIQKNNPEYSIEELWELSALEARKKREEFLHEEGSFCYETVFSHPSHIDFLKKAKDRGDYIVGYFITTKSPDINIARVRRRVLQGGHTVPIEKIKPRYERCMKLAVELMQISNIFLCFDNSTDNRSAKNVLIKDGKVILPVKNIDDYPYLHIIIEEFFKSDYSSGCSIEYREKLLEIERNN